MEIWTSMSTVLNVCAEEDHMIWSKGPEQPLNGPDGEIVWSAAVSKVKKEQAF